jgi:DNA-binding YbaB/EbfC family protein
MIDFSQLSQLSGLVNKAQSLQDTLKNIEETGDTGTGVTVTLNGKGECLHIHIEPDLVQEHQNQILEDLIRASFNDAQTKIKERHAEETSKLFGKLPFNISQFLP